MLQYTINEYLTNVHMSSNPTLLVEGADDKRFFKFLAEDYQTLVEDARQPNIHIDCADMLSNEESMGNREKVEEVAERIRNKTYKNRFLGFVDREFREFIINDHLEDTLMQQKQEDRLIWSRGHSIENYLFDFSILRKPLRDFSVSDHFDKALDLMEENFVSIIRIAGAFSLTAYKTEMISLGQGAMSWKIFDFTDDSLKINMNSLEERLLNIHNLDSERTEKFLSEYTNQIPLTEKANFEVVRWVTHGHIGMKTIWAAYGKFISGFAPGEEEQEVQKVLKADESVRFNSCTSSWSAENLGPLEESPVICFTQLLEVEN